EACGNLLFTGIVPKAKARFGEALPGEMPVGVNLAARRHIGMTHKIGGRNAVGFFEPFQQLQETLNLQLGKWFIAVVVDLNTDAAAVDIGKTTPLAYSGMVRPELVVEHMIHFPFAA